MNGNADNNLIAGNLIGISADGLTAIPNNGGVLVSTGAESSVGGPVAGQSNIISGNTTYGVSSSAGAVQANVIGLNFFGDIAVPNGDDGVLVTGPALVGGAIDAARNVISANADQGVDISIAGGGATVQGDWIGPDGSGAPIPATQQGDGILAAVPATITGNTIVGHNHLGIGLAGTSDGSLIESNRIGISPTLATSIVAGDTGIEVPGGADDVEIRGNTIAGNSGSGIESSADGLIVEGNTLGLDATGVATSTSDNEEGINLAGGTGARIGGTTARRANVISGNGFDGIIVTIGDDNTAIQGNRIGDGRRRRVARGPTAGGRRVQLNGAATVGGTAAGAGERHRPQRRRRRRGHRRRLVRAGSSATASSPTAPRSPRLGIDSATRDAASPPTTRATATSGAERPAELPGRSARRRPTARGPRSTGTIDTTPGAPIRIELFSSAACDDGGHGQGEVFLGATTVTAGAGATAFSADVGGTTRRPADHRDGDRLTTNETSEFSAASRRRAKPAHARRRRAGHGAPPRRRRRPSAAAGPSPPVAEVPGEDPGAAQRRRRRGARHAHRGDRRARGRGRGVSIDYESSGRHTKFTVPITGTQVKVRKKLPSSQPKDTGITTVTYAGNSIVDPDDVRLRAADGKSLLVRHDVDVSGGRLTVDGTVTSRARGVVRIRLGYAKPDGSTGFLDWHATIDDGKWRIAQALPAEAARGGQLSIQFTGYEAREPARRADREGSARAERCNARCGGRAIGRAGYVGGPCRARSGPVPSPSGSSTCPSSSTPPCSARACGSTSSTARATSGSSSSGSTR